jgi:hypothetical protein
MGEERMSLSVRERDRLKVLYLVERGKLKQTEAGSRLGLSERQVRRLLRRVAREGDRAVMHRLRGRASNRKMAEGIERQALEQLGARRYADFGPTLAAEHLSRQGVEVSRETLRKWMVRAGLWRARRQKIEAVHVWRQRRAADAAGRLQRDDCGRNEDPKRKDGVPQDQPGRQTRAWGPAKHPQPEKQIPHRRSPTSLERAAKAARTRGDRVRNDTKKRFASTKARSA